MDFITITSFNEWGEGTQIEAAIEDKSVSYMKILKEFKQRVGIEGREQTKTESHTITNIHNKETERVDL